MGVRVQSRYQTRRLSAFNCLNYPTYLVDNHATAHVKGIKKEFSSQNPVVSSYFVD